MKALVFLFSAAFAVSSFAGNTCVQNGQLVNGIIDSENWVELSKSFAIDAAKKDLKGFCEWNRMDRSLSGSGGSPEKYRKLKFEGNRDAAADELITHRKTDDEILSIWGSSFTGHPKIKALGFSNFFNLCPTTSLDCAPKIVEALNRKDLKSNYDVLEYNETDPIVVPERQLIGGCAYIAGTLGTFGCRSASVDLLKLVQINHPPGTTTRITGVPLIKDAITDKGITTALQRVAYNLWSKIQKKNFSDKDNIFTDLTTELQRNGIPEEQARKKALQVLGAIATGGPNFSWRVDKNQVEQFPDLCVSDGCNMNAIFMSAIAEGMVHADTIKLQNGNVDPYSLPAGVNFPCDSGKSYHFWYSAALTDRLVDMGHSAKSARSAAFLSNIGYQMSGSDLNQNRSSNLLSMARYGALENGMRIDLNFSAAGSSFGANIKERSGAKDLNLKDGYLKMMEQGSSTPSNPDQAFEKGPTQVYDWLQRTAAKSVFDGYP